MGDADAMILPFGVADGDDSGLRELLELVATSEGRGWAELVIRCRHTGRESRVAVGRPSGPSATVDLSIGGTGSCTLRLAGSARPQQRVIDLFAAAVEREHQRRRFLAETALLQAAANSADASILIFGPTGTIVFANSLADLLISKQTEDELTVQRNGGQPEPLFRLLCSKVGELLEQPDNSRWNSRFDVSDGSELSCELVVLTTEEDTLGRFVMAILREVAGPTEKRVDDFVELYRLSPREHEVLRLLVQGFDTTGLAERLGISPHTVRDHLKNVFRKTSSRSRSELLSALTGGSSH